MKIFLAVLMIFALASPLFAGEGNEETYIRQGTDNLAVGDYKKATKAFENAIKLNPRRPEAHAGLGMSFLKLGNNESMTNPELLEKAIAAFRRALDLNPNLADVRFALGITHLALYDKDAAVREYEALKGLDAELTGKLLTLINSYTPPARYKAIGPMQEEEVSPRSIPYTPPSLPPASSGGEGVVTNSDYEKKMERCVQEMERQISHSGGTTTMSSKQKAQAHHDYEVRKILFLKSCMGQYSPKTPEYDTEFINDLRDQKHINNSTHPTYRDDPYPKNNIGMCMGACASEEGICISQCGGSGQCISNCSAVQGRCTARCSQ